MSSGLLLSAFPLSMSACSSESGPRDSGAADLAPVDKAARCASTFGNGLTAGFGRLDGRILAVVPPGHPTCPRPNSDHLVIQIDAGGEVYRMVVNVLSD